MQGSTIIKEKKLDDEAIRLVAMKQLKYNEGDTVEVTLLKADKKSKSADKFRGVVVQQTKRLLTIKGRYPMCFMLKDLLLGNIKIEVIKSCTN